MGKLILLNTPIGNLQDITPRAMSAYKEGKTFVAEDTRTFKSLLNSLGISLKDKKFISFHDHSSIEQINKILEYVHSDDIYIVSDAGSPAISDPAYPLVKQAYEQGIDVDSFSGVSALTMALELSGFPPITTTFLGFFPRDKAKIQTLFNESLVKGGTFIFFESPKRVVKTLEILVEVAEQQIEFRVMRELTKQFQEIVTVKTISDLTRVTARGEFVIAYHIARTTSNNLAFEKSLELFLAGKRSKKDLAKFLAEFSHYSSKELYKLLN